MKRRSIAISMILIVLLALLPASALAFVEEWDSEDKERGTKYYIAPYAWMMGLNGTVGTKGYSTKVDAPFKDSLSNLDFAGMIAMEAVFQNKFGVALNMSYVDLSDQASYKGVAMSGESSIFFGNMFMFYRVGSERLNMHPSAYINFDLLAGANYWDVNMKLDVDSTARSGRVSKSSNWFDPVVGARAQIRFNDKWSLVLQGLLGRRCNTCSTWDASARFGYRIGNDSTLILGYRAVSVNRKEDNGFVFNSTLRGPVIGVIFKL